MPPVHLKNQKAAAARSQAIEPTFADVRRLAQPVEKHTEKGWLNGEP